MYFLTGIQPSSMSMDGLNRFGRSEENARARNQWHHGVRGLFAAVFWRGEKLDLSHTFVFTSQIRRREPGGESGSASLCTDALPEFSGSALLYSSALPEVSG